MRRSMVAAAGVLTCAAIGVGAFETASGATSTARAPATTGHVPYCTRPDRFGPPQPSVLGPRVTAFRNAPNGGTLFSIVYYNRSSSKCKVAGIPGAQPSIFASHGQPVGPPGFWPVGPPSIRTSQAGRGKTIVLYPHAAVETDYVIGPSAASLGLCRTTLSSSVIIRPMGIKAMVVGLPAKAGVRRLVCQNMASTGIYGFKSASGNPPRPKPYP